MTRRLNALEMDALRETGNLGAGRAATALSRLLGRSVTIDVPRIALADPAALPALVGGAEAVVAAVYFRLAGDAPGRMVLLLEKASLRPLLESLLGTAAAEPLPLSGEAESAVRELGNIVCGGYLNAISELVGFSLVLSVPALAVDTAEAVLASVAAEAAQHGSPALLLDSSLSDERHVVPLRLLYLPDPGALESLLAGLARSTGVDPRGGRV